MSVIHSGYSTLSQFHPSPSDTGVLEDSALTTSHYDRYRAQWNDLIDQVLLEWSQSTDCFDEDGIISPSGDALGQALDFAMYARDSDQMLDAPRAVPDGDGGLVLRWDIDGNSFVITFLENGDREWLVFEGERLVDRRR